MILFCISLLILISCQFPIKQDNFNQLMDIPSYNHLNKKFGFYKIKSHIMPEILTVESRFFLDCKDNQLTVRELDPWLANSKQNTPIPPSVEIYDVKETYVTGQLSYDPRLFWKPVAIIPMNPDKKQSVFSSKDYFVLKATTSIPDGKYLLRIGTPSSNDSSWIPIYTTSYSESILRKQFIPGDISSGILPITVSNGSLLYPKWQITFFNFQSEEYKFILRNEFNTITQGKTYFVELNDYLKSIIYLLENRFKLKRSTNSVLIVDKPVLYRQYGPDFALQTQSAAFTLSPNKHLRLIFIDLSPSPETYTIFFVETMNAFFEQSSSGMLQEGFIAYLMQELSIKEDLTSQWNLSFINKFAEKYINRKSTDYMGLEKYLRIGGYGRANAFFGPEYMRGYYRINKKLVTYLIEMYGFEMFFNFYYSLDIGDLGISSYADLDDRFMAYLDQKE